MYATELINGSKERECVRPWDVQQKSEITWVSVEGPLNYSDRSQQPSASYVMHADIITDPHFDSWNRRRIVTDTRFHAPQAVYRISGNRDNSIIAHRLHESADVSSPRRVPRTAICCFI